MTLARVVTAEALDQLAPSDPAARRSRRDLARIHRVMATRSIIVRGWQSLVSSRDELVPLQLRLGLPLKAALKLPPKLPMKLPTKLPMKQPLKVLELGAGDGTLLLGVARRLGSAWPPVQLTLLDRQPVVSRATLAEYASLGWDATVQVADVLDWAAPASGSTDAPTAPRWDLISTSLFLHHFEGAQLDAVLRAVAARSPRFFACEPRRHWLALAGSHLVGALGANAVTRDDAVLSVHAGFCGQDLGSRWPGGGTWQCREYAAGLFSHCFSAQQMPSGETT